MKNFAIATFCYGDRYHRQVNRMISEIDLCDFKPTVVVVTDDTSKIIDKSFVKKYDITDFNPDYKIFSESYYTFDFSVKRYSLLAALNLGFNKIILTDADAVPNKSLFKEDYMIKGFVENSIQGQVTYNFSQQIVTNSQLGKRFLFYENYYGVNYNKNELNFMPEDCIQFLDIEIPKFYNFLRVWDQLIKIKNSNNLSNTPAGNIDEMCFAALNCGISVGNNSDKTMNSMINIHDKWYDTHLIVPTESIKVRKKTIVSSVYELNYIDERGGAVYKSFHLLTETLRSIIFDDYNYVIYTDQKTCEKHNLLETFKRSNVEIKFCELNSDFYLTFLDPIRQEKNKSGEIYDRIFCVKNYVEVMYNKLKFLVEVAHQNDSDVCWVDAGLFGTSCHNAWRDYLKDNIVHNKNFIDKIFEKIEEHSFIALKGQQIAINYEVKEKLKNKFGEVPFIVPGGLFGGKKEQVINYLSDYTVKINEIVDCLKMYTSDQELMCLLLQKKVCKLYEFNDWDDLQRGILKIMDLYDEETYQTDSCYKKIETNEKMKIYGATIIESNYEETRTDNINYPLLNREIIEKIINVSNLELDNLDLTHNDYMLNNMLSFAQYYHYPSGQEHYRLLSYITKLYENEILYDIGTCNGCSAIALSDNENNLVKTFDIVDYKEPGVIQKNNIEFYMENILENIGALEKTRFILLDTNHDGFFENAFYKKLKEINYKGILVLDDIYLNSTMKTFWNQIEEEKFDITSKGHNTGTGLVLFE
jgi:predicted RNase H-like nuclease